MRETPRSKANQHTCGAHGRGRHRCPRRIAPHLALRNLQTDRDGVEIGRIDGSQSPVATSVTSLLLYTTALYCSFINIELRETVTPPQ